MNQLEDHFSDLVTERRPDFQERGVTNSSKTENDSLSIQFEKVEKAIKELKNGKAPRPGAYQQS